MANDTDVVKSNIRVWATIGSAVFWAPKGTSLPETPFEDLDPAFSLIGAMTTDGPSEGLSVESNDLKIWPGGQTGRTVNTATDKTFAFTALEEKPVVTRIFYGHGDVTVTGSGAQKFAEYEIPEAIGTVEGVMVAIFVDGDDALKVRKMELVQVSERGDRGNSTEGGEGFEMTVKVIGKDSVMTTQASYLETVTP